MKAMVVDDSRAMRMIEQKALESMGWEVVQAGNGIEALAALAKIDHLDLMLADWQMPEMDGLSLVKAIRQDEKWAGLPIIMVSSNAALESAAEALEAGATDFVMKPFTVDSLKERVTGAMNA